MASAPPRSSHAWTLLAQVIGGGLLGLIEAAKLRSATVGVVLVPLFALTGLIAGALIAGAGRLADRVLARPTPAWRADGIRAALVAAPSLLITGPVAPSLFAGPYAQTLPLASVLPFLLPVVAWGGITIAIVIGRRLVKRGDLVSRAIAILAVAGLLGAILFAKKRVLGTGYPEAQTAVALTAIVLFGVLVQQVRRAAPSKLIAAATAGLVIGATVAASVRGLTLARDRKLLADTRGLGYDLVEWWRGILDLDRDGSSPWLGGGDCDDFDGERRPGKIDTPEDGIDQDCDGHDAKPPPPPPAPPSANDLATWRALPAVKGVLDRTRTMNVVLISVDALRYDLLAPDAPHRDDFPRLRKLLDDSVLFTRAVSPAAGTDVSLSTLVSGRSDPFQPVERTLWEALQTLGLRTSVALPSEVTRHVGEVLVHRGMDTTRVVHTDWAKANIGDHISGGTTTAEGVRAIDKALSGFTGANTPNGPPRRFAAWVHYFDVHEHHQLEVPDALLTRVHDGGSEAVHRYRALLLGVDAAIGKLLDELAARDQLASTIIVFLSDHGEALGEDPRLPATHGQAAYPPLVRIPIAFHIPGVPGGVRTDPVSLVDIAPTLLALLGGPDAMQPLDGIDLVPALLDGPAALRPAPNRALIVHEEKQKAVVEWPYHLVLRPEEDLVELYNVETDPTFTKDLSADDPALTARLRARYAEVPEVRIDRTAAGRAWREAQAQKPPPRATP